MLARLRSLLARFASMRREPGGRDEAQRAADAVLDARTLRRFGPKA
jgi:hypothetical protein